MIYFSNIIGKDMDFRNLDRTWVVAEIGVNHEGDYDCAVDMIRKAAGSGADAVKFQTFRTEYYVSTEQPERFTRAKGFELEQSQFTQLASVAKECGVTFFSTPLHNDDIDFLKTIAPLIKISSGDLTHLSLIEHAAKTGLPLILSTGLGTQEEIASAIRAVEHVRPDIREEGDLMLMHCVAAYPTPAEQANLKNISWLQDNFGLPVGYSDHTLGTKACELAVAVGAVALEKHFTYRKEDQSFHDHHISANPTDLAELVSAVRNAEAYLGKYERQRGEEELKLLQHMRRSLGAVRDLKAGNVITAEDLTYLRPAWGLQPEQFDSVIGRSLVKDIVSGALIREEDLAS